MVLSTIKEEWDSMAHAYEAFNTDEDSYSYNIEWPCIKDMLPDLEGKSILDLGCGTGIFTYLFEKSAPSELVGIDLSGEMLDIAKSKARVQQSKAKFIQGDISRTSEYVENLYDFIFSSTTTHYIFDLGKLFNSIAEKLKPNGCSILSIIHPLYSAMYPIKHGNAFPDDNDWKIKYLDKNERSYIQPWIEYNDSFDNRLSMSYHHLFSDYINAIVHAGLKVCEIREPVPPEKWKTDYPDRYNGFIDTPIFMIIKITK